MRLLVVLIALIVFAAPSFAEDKAKAKEEAIRNIMKTMDLQGIKSKRYGPKHDKPLGAYNPEPKIEFKTGYKDLDPLEQAKWAYELGTWFVAEGGGFKNMERYEKGESSKQQAIAEWTGQGFPENQHPQALAKLPYKKLEKFAKEYWEENSDKYKSSLLPPKDWWIHESIVDGMTLWLRYNRQNLTDNMMFNEAYLQMLHNKKP